MGSDYTTLFFRDNVFVPSVDPISQKTRMLEVVKVIINLGGVLRPNPERCLQNSAQLREFRAHK